MSNQSKHSPSAEEVKGKATSGSIPLKRETEKTSSPTESQLVSFGDRITYVFALGKEVGSIHYDKGRGEIFYKGHNIRNMELEEWQMQMIEKMRRVLSEDEKGRDFADPYGRVVDKITLEKKRPKKI